MPIKVLTPSGLRFHDAHNTLRLIRGVSLPQRSQFRALHQTAMGLFSQHIEGGGELESLFNDVAFLSLIAQILGMVHIKPEWLRNAEVNRIPELILSYPDERVEYLGKLIDWEFPTPLQPSNEIPRIATELHAFSSLLIEDVNGALLEVFPLPLSKHYRFVDLLKLARERAPSGFHHAYDCDRIFARVVHEALSLFDLTPNQISAALARELLFSDWIEDEPGKYQVIPGWLDQLCNPPKAFESKGKTLPKEESPEHALIASMWGDKGLGGAISDANAVPYPVLRSILHSRNRMLDEITKTEKTARDPNKPKYSKADQAFLDTIDFDELEKEFLKDPTPPASLPTGAMSAQAGL